MFPTVLIAFKVSIPFRITVKVSNGSVAVKDSVTVSPTVASSEFVRLLEEIDTLVNVGICPSVTSRAVTPANDRLSKSVTVFAISIIAESFPAAGGLPKRCQGLHPGLAF